MTIQVGFKYRGKYRLAFELKVKSQGDVYVFVFERGRRREHVSYHKDGRVNYSSDQPGEEHVRVKWDGYGAMEPMRFNKTPVKEIAGRQKVGVAGWATEDIEVAELPEFAPQPDDIVVEPTTPTTGFSVNIISPGTPARNVGHLHLPVLARYVRGTAPILEIETFDWSAPQQPDSN
jgi:hypothetical protein